MKVTGKLPTRRRKPKAPTSKPVSRVARMLALAHHIDRLVDDGTLRNYAEAARLLGVSRARMTQIVGLLGLSAEIQNGILTGEVEVSERVLRKMARVVEWGEQAQA